MWDEIIQDTLFIGQTADDLNQEIEINTWLISMSDIERAATAPDTLMTFFQAVMDNRREQIQQAQTDHGMWFYVWHDQQAAQLRFSLISDFYNRLPFGCQTIFVDLLTLIREFLESQASLSWVSFEISDHKAEEHIPEDILLPYVLPVFCVQLL